MEGATKTPVPGGKGSAARARDSRPVEFGRKLVWAAFQYFTNPNSSEFLVPPKGGRRERRVRHGGFPTRPRGRDRRERRVRT